MAQVIIYTDAAGHIRGWWKPVYSDLGGTDFGGVTYDGPDYNSFNGAGSVCCTISQYVTIGTNAVVIAGTIIAISGLVTDTVSYQIIGGVLVGIGVVHNGVDAIAGRSEEVAVCLRHPLKGAW